MKAPVTLVALFLAGCVSTPINTISLPSAALEARPLPVLGGTSNRDIGIYAIECKAALEAREEDIESIRGVQ